nr:ABC transporter ATP-binding protein [Oceanococcus sp. HetDA_MAG_MS8]
MTNQRLPLIKAQALHHTLRHGTQSLQILRGIDLELDSGQSVAIIGPSGSGKSTLLSLLAGFEQPTQGGVSWGSVSLASLDEEGRARLRAQQLGFVFQSFALLPQLSALDNVRVAADIAGLNNPLNKARQSLVAVGLGERLAHKPAQLSGGEQQRVALARAFVHQPKLLLADEPTGNLDPDTGQTIIDLMFSLVQGHNSGLLMVTHDLQLAQRCHRQYRLDAGVLRPLDEVSA